MKSRIFEKQLHSSGTGPSLQESSRDSACPHLDGGACSSQYPPRPALGRDFGEHQATRLSLWWGSSAGSGAAATRGPLQGRLWFPWQPHHCHRDWHLLHREGPASSAVCSQEGPSQMAPPFPVPPTQRLDRNNVLLQAWGGDVSWLPGGLGGLKATEVT